VTKGKAGGESINNGMAKTNITSIMGSTMDQTVNMMNTLDQTRSSPFRETISQGMITGVGMFNNGSF
jgi:hypothetical protein